MVALKLKPAWAPMIWALVRPALASSRKERVQARLVLGADDIEIMPANHFSFMSGGKHPQTCSIRRNPVTSKIEFENAQGRILDEAPISVFARAECLTKDLAVSTMNVFQQLLGRRKLLDVGKST